MVCALLNLKFSNRGGIEHLTLDMSPVHTEEELALHKYLSDDNKSLLESTAERPNPITCPVSKPAWSIPFQGSGSVSLTSPIQLKVGDWPLAWSWPFKAHVWGDWSKVDWNWQVPVAPSRLARQLTQRSRYPLLSRVAIDVPSIPPMSAEEERLLPSAKKSFDDLWNSLHATSYDNWGTGMEFMVSCLISH